MAFYSYARMVDEIGDTYEGDRCQLLDLVECQLSEVLADTEAVDVWPIVAGAARSVWELGADPKPLFDLIAANRQDQVVNGYTTFEDLLGYCALSANPVGRLVLVAFGADSPERAGWSDAICTGLQLAEHWQDVAEDALAGRVYVPKEDLERFGVEPAAFKAGRPVDPTCRALMVFEVARARRFLDAGAPLISSLTGAARWAVAGFWAGGHAALDGIASRRFEVLTSSPRTSRLRTITMAVGALRGGSTARVAA